MQWKKNQRNVDVPLKLVHPNIKNPRKQEYYKDAAAMGELKESMASMGQLTSIKLDEDGVILAGHRRFHVAKLLEWATIRADIITGKSSFEKSAILISDNATQRQFSAWEHRKSINDIYWNEFCEEYEFKKPTDKGYSAFARKLGISQVHVRRIIESMRKENLDIARKLEATGVKGISAVYQEIIIAPKKHRGEVFKETLKLIKRKQKIGTSGTGVKDSLRDYIRNFKARLVVEDAKDKLHPSYFSRVYHYLRLIKEFMTKEVVKRMTEERKMKLRKEIEQNILPVYNLLKNGKKK